jgi:hypothetical protein
MPEYFGRYPKGNLLRGFTEVKVPDVARKDRWCSKRISTSQLGWGGDAPRRIGRTKRYSELETL